MKENCAPVVTVVIPVYMVEDYIRECVDSVLNQTYTNLEIILVDDGSSDHCPQICDDYALTDSRVKVIHKANGGLSDARNCGMDAATGDYVYFLDSDDYVEPFAIELLVRTAQNNDSDMVFFDARSFYTENSEKKAADSSFYTRKYIYLPGSGPDTVMLLSKNKEFRSAVPLLFFKTTLLKTAQVSFFPGILHEDELFTPQLFLKSERVSHVPYPLYNRRIRSGSIMTSKMTARNFHSYSTVALELTKLYMQTEPLSKECLFLEYFLPVKYLKALNVYTRLSFDERSKCRKEHKLLQDKLCENQYFGNNRSYFGLTTRAARKLLSGKEKLTPSVKTRLSFGAALVRHRYKEDLTVLKSTVGQKRILLLCTPLHRNLGDHLIAAAQLQFFRESFPGREVTELSFPSVLENLYRAKKYITEDDVLVICGGGWLGTLWYHDEFALRKILCEYPKNKIIIMPQTVFYSEDAFGEKELDKARKIYNRHAHLYLALRDQRSHRFCIDRGLVPSERCFYLPDVALLYKPEPIASQRESDKVIFCFRKDNESVLDAAAQGRLELDFLQKGYRAQHFSTVLSHRVSPKDRDEEIRLALNDLATAACVVTDRLHCMILCALSQTPCIAFDNLSSKVSGVYEWIRDLGYISVLTDPSLVFDALENTLSADRHYDRERLSVPFHKIAEIID